jgi:hypothetical protein
MYRGLATRDECARKDTLPYLEHDAVNLNTFRAQIVQSTNDRARLCHVPQQVLRVVVHVIRPTVLHGPSVRLLAKKDSDEVILRIACRVSRHRLAIRNIVTETTRPFHFHYTREQILLHTISRPSKPSAFGISKSRRICPDVVNHSFTTIHRRTRSAGTSRAALRLIRAHGIYYCRPGGQRMRLKTYPCSA